jgi:hypothetical protein
MRARLLVTTVLGASCAFFACTSTDTGAVATADGGADSGPELEGGTTDAAADAPTEAGPPGDVGGIFAISDSITVDGGPRALHRAGAFFTHSTGEDTTTIAKTVGPCLVEKIGNGNTPDETDLSAGTIHITGGTRSVDLVPNAKKTYDAVTGSVALWNGGETLTVAGEGKDVPAFTTSLVAPSKLTMTAPALPSPAGALSVTRSAPFSATWSGASSGLVVLYFDAATGANAFSATCTFQASAGKAEVPAAAFAEFPAIDGTFNFYVKEAAVASPPGWTIRFTVSSAIVDPAGASAIGSATFK